MRGNSRVKTSVNRDKLGRTHADMARWRTVRSDQWNPDEAFWRHHFSVEELRNFIDLFDKLAAEAAHEGRAVRRDQYRAHIIKIAIAISKHPENTDAPANAQPDPDVDEISQDQCDQILEAANR